MPEDPNRRPQGLRRLPDYDYAQIGAYFVTLVTLDRMPLFGDIMDDAIRLSLAGEIVRHAWEDLPNHYLHVDLDAFVVMPNHVHGSIVLAADPPVGAGLKPAPTLPPGTAPVGAGLKPAPTPSEMPAPLRRHALPEIVRAWKTFSARRINEARGTPGIPVWQRNYYEHVIRDEPALHAIREYIQTNPQRWSADNENPRNWRWGSGRTSLHEDPDPR